MTDIDARLIAARRSAHATLAESAAKEIVSACGIAVPRSVTIDGAGAATTAFADLRPPLVAKLVSRQASHKSDVGGVRVDLRTTDAVGAACAEIAAAAVAHGVAVDGFLIEEMAPAGTEVVIGGMLDPTFGPVVMFGLGGIFIEVLADVAFRICPIEEIDAHEMIGEIAAAAVLDGVRGRPPASRDAIVQALLRLGGADGLLISHADHIREIDINPLIVSETAAMAADARIVLAEAVPADA